MDILCFLPIQDDQTIIRVEADGDLLLESQKCCFGSNVLISAHNQKNVISHEILVLQQRRYHFKPHLGGAEAIAHH